MQNVTISIDDLHPEQGWGCEGDESVGYLEELNKEFGCKFNLFIPVRTLIFLFTVYPTETP